MLNALHFFFFISCSLFCILCINSTFLLHCTCCLFPIHIPFRYCVSMQAECLSGSNEVCKCMQLVWQKFLARVLLFYFCVSSILRFCIEFVTRLFFHVLFCLLLLSAAHLLCVSHYSRRHKLKVKRIQQKPNANA